MAFAGRTRPNRSRPARGSLPPRPGEWHFPTRCSSPRRRFSLPPPMTSAPTSNPLPRQRPHVPHHAITLRRLPETPLRRARRPRTSTSRTLTKRTPRTVDRADVDHANILSRLNWPEIGQSDRGSVTASSGLDHQRSQRKLPSPRRSCRALCHRACLCLRDYENNIVLWQWQV